MRFTIRRRLRALKDQVLLLCWVVLLVRFLVVPFLGSTRTMHRTGHKCLCFSMEERTHTNHINNH